METDREEFRKFFSRLLALESNSQLEIDALRDVRSLLKESWRRYRIRNSLAKLKAIAYEIPKNIKMTK